ncbi:MAG TPA: hemerythrin domain-containing protein [Actinomycetales bacterium]|nr:hemerythrin domain-containing protein [Actinomycetales bacterium]
MTTDQARTLSDDDMQIMRVLHNAFRRDAARLADAAAHYETVDAETHDALLLGWHGFSSALHHHHTVEDRHIWPVMRRKLADRPDDLAVLDAMECEHALIDPALEALERAFDDREGERDEIARPIDDIVVLLHSHLGHEERDAFPLMREVITSQEWARLNRDAMKELSYSQLAELGPYILEGEPPDDARRVLAELPAPLRLVHRMWWNPRYQRARRWK